MTMIHVDVARRRRQRKPSTAFKFGAVTASASDTANPFPAPRDVAAAAFTDGCTHIGVAFDDSADSAPELFAPFVPQFRAQHIVTKLADSNVGLFDATAGMQGSLRGETVESGRDQLRHTSDIRAAGTNTCAGVGQSGDDQS